MFSEDLLWRVVYLWRVSCFFLRAAPAQAAQVLLWLDAGTHQGGALLVSRHRARGAASLQGRQGAHDKRDETCARQADSCGPGRAAAPASRLRRPLPGRAAAGPLQRHWQAGQPLLRRPRSGEAEDYAQAGEAQGAGGAACALSPRRSCTALPRSAARRSASSSRCAATESSTGTSTSG